MIQVVAKLDDEMAAAIDALVEQGRFASRSAAVRSGVSALIERERRAEVGAQIVAGYEAVPETAEELSQAVAASRAMIDEEPWSCRRDPAEPRRDLVPLAREKICSALEALADY